MFKKGVGNWTQYRELHPWEVDFHYEKPRDFEGPRGTSYEDLMEKVWREALEALKDAHEYGTRYVLFTHGSSTSRPGRTTARSMVRKLMRSAYATPFILRRECIQHETVFLAAIRPKPKLPQSGENSSSKPQPSFQERIAMEREQQHKDQEPSLP
jgi:hypothetical protein